MTAEPGVSCWPLSRLLMLCLMLGFLGLVVDLRIEHADVVKEHIIGWTPIIYSGVMTLACLLGVVFWNQAMRRLLMALFGLAFVVGGLGMYFHNHGNFLRPAQLGLQAWTDSQMKHPHGPPTNAPMAFAGLGLLGVLASLPRFNGRKP